MNCRLAKKLIPSSLAPNEPWLTSTDRADLISHIARCDSCRQDYEETRQIVHLFQQYGQISEETQALIDKAMLEEPGQKAARTLGLSPIATKVASIAAAIIISLGIGWAFWGSNANKQGGAQQASIQKQPTTLQITENDVPIPASGIIKTDSTQIRELLIDNKHQLVINRDTTLSIGLLVSNGKQGCKIELHSGQILAHVEHDGNPFEVHSPHGKAVITGTTFDVKVTDHETALVVAEGSVQFESTKGMVQVLGGHRSKLRAQSQPTEPVACNAPLLMAWATGSDAVPKMADSQVDKLIEDLPLPLTYQGQPVDLESLDYDGWIEEKRDWFKGQFPWIFAILEELTTNNQELATEAIPDYAELLIQTGDLWQIVYPHRFYRQISVIQRDSLAKVADRYQLGSTYVNQIFSQKRNMVLPTTQMSFGQDALNHWLIQAREAELVCDNTDKLTEFCEYSMAIGKFLENTRALVWLCMKNGSFTTASGQKEACLNLLGQQVALACQVQQAAWQLAQTEDSSNEGRIRRLITFIEVIQELEMQINDTRAPVNREPLFPNIEAREGLLHVTRIDLLDPGENKDG